MKPTTSRLHLALVTLALVCAFTLSGIIVTRPHGGLTGAVSTGWVQGWPIKYIVPGTGVIQHRGVPR